MSDKPFLYPNVSSLPTSSGAGSVEQLNRREQNRPAREGEFPGKFEEALSSVKRPDEKVSTIQQKSLSEELSQVRTPLKFSSHALQRLQDRKIKIDQEWMGKINDAVDRAAAKGVEDTLVLTDQAAMIVSVKNRTVVTAMDRATLNGNVFTNIDGAVIV